MDLERKRDILADIVEHLHDIVCAAQNARSRMDIEIWSVSDLDSITGDYAELQRIIQTVEPIKNKFEARLKDIGNILYD